MTGSSLLEYAPDFVRERIVVAFITSGADHNHALGSGVLHCAQNFRTCQWPSQTHVNHVTIYICGCSDGLNNGFCDTKSPRFTKNAVIIKLM